jgi:hypothetical protein
MLRMIVVRLVDRLLCQNRQRLEVNPLWDASDRTDDDFLFSSRRPEPPLMVFFLLD